MSEPVASALPYSFEVLMRYRLIEIIALWEGRLTTNHLCQSFQIKRQQASKDINKYNQDIAPGNLVLDRKLKGYRPSSTFKPVFTRGIAEEYLLALASNRDISHNFSTLDLGFHQTEMLHSPMRHVDPQILRALVQAARTGEKIDMGYVSMTSPRRREPHHHAALAGVHSAALARARLLREKPRLPRFCVKPLSLHQRYRRPQREPERSGQSLEYRSQHCAPARSAPDRLPTRHRRTRLRHGRWRAYRAHPLRLSALCDPAIKPRPQQTGNQTRGAANRGG